MTLVGCHTEAPGVAVLATQGSLRGITGLDQNGPAPHIDSSLSCLERSWTVTRAHKGGQKRTTLQSVPPHVHSDCPLGQACIYDTHSGFGVLSIFTFDFLDVRPQVAELNTIKTELLILQPDCILHTSLQFA